MLISAAKAFSKDDQDLLKQAACDHASILPVQLAALGIKPRLPWGSGTHSLAAARGDGSVLKWLLQQEASPRAQGCPPGLPSGLDAAAGPWAELEAALTAAIGSCRKIVVEQVHGSIQPPSKAALQDVLDRTQAFAETCEARQAYLMQSSLHSKPDAVILLGSDAVKSMGKTVTEGQRLSGLPPTSQGQPVASIVAADTSAESQPEPAEPSAPAQSLGYLAKVRQDLDALQRQKVQCDGFAASTWHSTWHYISSCGPEILVSMLSI